MRGGCLNDGPESGVIGAPADRAEKFRPGRSESYFCMHGDLVSYLVLHTGQASSFGGCMALVSYLDTARRLASFLAKKPRFVTTSKVRSCHKAGATAAHDPDSQRRGCCGSDFRSNRSSSSL